MDVKEFIRKCDICIRNKKYVLKAIIFRTENLMYPFYRVGIDTVGPIVGSSNGFKYILVCTDYYSRYTITRPVKNKSAKTVANFLIDDVITKHGPPRVIQSDRGLEFLNEVVSEVCCILSIRRSVTAGYNPKCNGLVERSNGLICIRITKMIRNNLMNWEQYVPLATYAYNISPMKRLKFSPFEILFNRTPVLINSDTMSNLVKIKSEGFIDYKMRRDEHKNEMDAVVSDARNKELNREDQIKASNDEFGVNDLVLVKIPKVHQRKLMETWDGPCNVVRVCGKGGYEVADLEGKTRIVNRKDLQRAEQYFDKDEWLSHEEGKVLGEPTLVANLCLCHCDTSETSVSENNIKRKLFK
ncbi:POL4 [Hepatospora eriocheir]|uniref:POL4 n=1 Tax=Hepatospora eriocheir TaxID=1081669 RepID=A0A1X0Q7C5_9MICR|nr:POL4 [Hepatospora eriocheir]